MITLAIIECTGRKVDDDYVVSATLTSDNHRTRDMFQVLYDELMNDKKEGGKELDFEDGVLSFSDILFTDLCLAIAAISAEVVEPAEIVVDKVFFKEDLLHVAKFYYKIGGSQNA